MIDDRLKAILAGVLDVDADGIGDEFSSVDTASWDSIGMLRLVTAIEEAFGTRVYATSVQESQS